MAIDREGVAEQSIEHKVKRNLGFKRRNPEPQEKAEEARAVNA